MFLYLFFKALRAFSKLSIFKRLSASFLRSSSTTCSGAWATKASLESFFRTESRNLC